MRAVRRGLTAGAIGGTLILMTAACGGGGSTAAGAGHSTPVAGKSAAPAPAVSAAVLDIEPKSGATDVKPSGALKVSVASGKLTTVSVADRDGKPVPGAIAADGASWAPTGALSIGTQYSVSAQATDAGGVVATAASTFSTLTPTKQAKPHDNISDGETYGVGMIVSLDFGSQGVQDKAAVEKGVTFETSDGSVLKGHWFGDQRLDFRPAAYWKSGTKVTIHYRLKSVEVAPGVYGGVDADEPFTIGRSQISTADANSDKMTVVRDGQQVQTIPITAGSAAHATWNGKMVIEAKEGLVRMDSNTVPGLGAADHYDLMVPHSMRLTESGTFVHGNYWHTDAMGSYNASHGCIGLADVEGGSNSSSAGKFFADSMVGDVVEVVNSKGGQVAADNGLSGWNIDWSAW